MSRRIFTLALAAALGGCTARVVDRPVEARPEPTATVAHVPSSGSGSTSGGSSGSSAASSSGSSASSAASSSTAASSSSSSTTSSTGSGSTSSSSSSTSTTGGSSSSTTGSTTGSPANPPGTTEPVGTLMTARSSVNLRQGPSTSDPVLVVVAAGSTVTVFEELSQGGFFNVSYGGIHGWSYGSYYDVTYEPSSSPLPTPREEAIQRGETAMGFSYWWGHGRFDLNGVTSSIAGSCSGSCPSCTHGGSYGGDCSGLVGKLWFLGNTQLDVDSHPYSTSDFVTTNSNWYDVSRSSLQMSDALVYNQNGAGHIFLYETGDGWGSMWAYECKGCSYGCVHDLRTAGTAYKGIGRTGW